MKISHFQTKKALPKGELPRQRVRGYYITLHHRCNTSPPKATSLAHRANITAEGCITCPQGNHHCRRLHHLPAGQSSLPKATSLARRANITAEGFITCPQGKHHCRRQHHLPVGQTSLCHRHIITPSARPRHSNGAGRVLLSQYMITQFNAV